MRLRRKFVLYLVLVHLLFAAGAAVFLHQHRIWLVAVEVLFAVSLAIALGLLRALFQPIDLLRSGIAVIEEQDFATRLRETGPPEAVELYSVYNKMVDHLREERIRLEEQNWFLVRILEASPSGILVFDFDNHIAAVNPAAERMFGSSAPKLIGRSLASLAGGENGASGRPSAVPPSIFAGELAALAVEEPRVLSLRGGRRVKCQRRQFFDRGFSRSFILLEELTEELRQSEKAAYEKLIRMMSHEVNNTAAAVGSLLESCLSYASQLREDDRQDFTGALSVAIGRVGQLNAFTREFAEVVRLPAPKRRPSDLERLIAGVHMLLREESTRRRIAWIMEIEGGSLPVDVDATQMEQVFLNIVKNAMEAIGTDGTITIRAGRDADHRCFATVRDSAGGIAPELREHLFTPFFTTKKDGQGIGLTVVQEILLAHDCDFTLESAPDGPTEFAIRFPAS